MSLFSIFDIAASSLTAQSVRLNTTASNMANAESGAKSADEVYKSKHPVFAEKPNKPNLFDTQSDLSGNMLQGEFGSSVHVQNIMEAKSAPRSNYEPGNPMADEKGFVYYPNINIVEQMTDMISASRSFQASVEVLSTTKDLMDRTLGLGE